MHDIIYFCRSVFNTKAFLFEKTRTIFKPIIVKRSFFQPIKTKSASNFSRAYRRFTRLQVSPRFSLASMVTCFPALFAGVTCSVFSRAFRCRHWLRVSPRFSLVSLVTCFPAIFAGVTSYVFPRAFRWCHLLRVSSSFSLVLLVTCFRALVLDMFSQA